jgi:hypothetical protein
MAAGYLHDGVGDRELVHQQMGMARHMGGLSPRPDAGQRQGIIVLSLVLVAW